ncbi:hypothetical protein RJ639_022170 [Escallonia herrerae]|uniref:Uncharacterized protein n=1 Tax=Escallonia herrerae TaxID=1293975 RepID=A0AA89AFY1_9ASTE|nr:hypothetical protein RJ639_022170 [Escallonia herrerae]
MNKSPPGNMKALLEKANKYIQAEKYLKTHRGRQEEGKEEQKKWSRELTHQGGKPSKRSKRDERRPKDPFASENLTPLNAKPSQILHEIKDNKALRWPDKMRSRPNKRNKDLWGQQTPPEVEEREAREEHAGTINTISGELAAGGSSGKSRKAYAREVCITSQNSSKKQKNAPVPTISFFDEDLKDVKMPHDDPLVITIKAGNFEVKRVSVNNGSSAEILFYDAFRTMNIPTDRLQKMDSSLYAVVSTYHLKMKFPMKNGIGEVKGDQTTTRQCYVTSCRSKNKEALIIEDLREDTKMQRGEPDENLVNIEVYLGDEDKTVRIGSNLKEDTKLELVNLLRTYADVFTWTAVYMPGIDPEVITHREGNGVQKSIYYVSKVLQDVETRYPKIGRIALALITLARRLRPYFQSHSIIVLTDQPLRKVYRASRHQEAVGSSGAIIILISPEGFTIEYALRFGFQASNNEAEYEALLTGIRLAHALKVDSLSVHSDSLLVVNHFKNFTIHQIPEDQNTQADALSRLASAEATDVRRSVYLEFLKDRSISSQTEIGVIDQEPCWMDMIIKFLSTGELPSERHEARNLRVKAARYALVEVAHPQSNGQTENMNRSILQGLKKKLDEAKGAWVDELPKVLLAYRTTPHSVIGETPFFLCYGTEALLPIEIGVPTIRALHFNKVNNEDGLLANLDLVEEARTQAHERSVVIKQRVARYYNQRVWSK